MGTISGSHRTARDRLRASTLRLRELLDRSEKKRAHQLSFDELRELGRLYRVNAAWLARVREQDEDPEAVRHLNAVCARAFALLYASRAAPRAQDRSASSRIFDAIADTWRPQLLAWVLLLLGALLGGALGSRDPAALAALVPSTLGYSQADLESLSRSHEARVQFLARQETPASKKAFFGASLFAHNTQVGLLAFATGILAGVPPVLLQLYSGMMLGAFGSIFFRDPWPIDFLAWILPHGIPELTAVTLCTAAGLALGKAVAAPGRLGRREALRAAVDPALLLFGVSIPLFFGAGVVESFVRESKLSTLTRLSIAGAFALWLLAGLAVSRHLAHQRRVDVSWLAELTGPRRSGSTSSGSGSGQRASMGADRA
jgi:uncharacterized membrane protein SpoIIM required for sporulation